MNILFNEFPGVFLQWIFWIKSFLGRKDQNVSNRLHLPASYTRADLREKLTSRVSDLCCNGKKNPKSGGGKGESQAPNKFRNPVALFASTSLGRNNPKGNISFKGSNNEANVKWKGSGLVHPFVNAKMNNNKTWGTWKGERNRNPHNFDKTLELTWLMVLREV